VIRVLHVTGEVAPYSKTGGLGDVCGALPGAQRAAGIDAQVITPLYGSIDRRSFERVGGVTVHLDARDHTATLWRDGHVTFVDVPGLLDRETPYGDVDDPLRFAVLCKVAASLPADVYHLHDWQAGATAFYTRKPMVCTVHNLAYQGLVDWSWAERIGVPEALHSWEGAEFHGKLSLLKAGLVKADRITTVSPTYAREILGPELGMGLDGLFRHRQPVLSGILNGLDPSAWDPAVDAPGGKAAAKAELRAEMGLEDGPLCVAVARAVEQKGLDLVAAAAPRVDARFAVLASGQPDIVAALRAVEVPGRFKLATGFSERLSRLMYAAADFVLVPSRFEPCGLTQIIAQRYGALPIVRRTGGLADTGRDGVDGFVFDDPTPEALTDALKRALAVYADPEAMAQMRACAEAREWSWAGPARAYAELYEGLVSG